jgi:hypothetical protein
LSHDRKRGGDIVDALHAHVVVADKVGHLPASCGIAIHDENPPFVPIQKLVELFEELIEWGARLKRLGHEVQRA